MTTTPKQQASREAKTYLRNSSGKPRSESSVRACAKRHGYHIKKLRKDIQSATLGYLVAGDYFLIESSTNVIAVAGPLADIEQFLYS